MKKVMIVGANFNNKGAQSMLFITVDAVKKICPECEVYFATTEVYDEEIYAFKRLYASDAAKQIALNNHRWINIVKSITKDIIKIVVGRRKNLFLFMDLIKVIPSIDLIIDVSGFNLGEKWSTIEQEAYLDNIRLAKKYNIPMVLMPQSFGPFDYDDKRQYILKEIEDLLPYPKVIYAREQEGYNLLKERFNLTNVERSTDLVLQNNHIDLENIFRRTIDLNIPKTEGDVVGVIPNNQCFKFGEKEKILAHYATIINELLINNKEIYVFRHSGEDLDACVWIYEMYQKNPHVHLVKNNFSCLEYDAYVKNFQFIVCSRYHGVVHAYRNAIPSIVLGWAVKYLELAKMVNQEKYVFNLLTDDADVKSVQSMTRQMLNQYIEEKNMLQHKVKEIQKNNCFEVLRNFI